MQYVADNVDHIVYTLTGPNTFHGMGIVATITPKVNSSIIIPKKIVYKGSLIQIWGIETKFVERRIGYSSTNPVNVNITKWSNTLQQFGKLPTNCLSVFDHFVGLLLKGLSINTWSICFVQKIIQFDFSGAVLGF